MASNMDRIQELRRELEDELGCGVIIWVKEDYPGATDEEKQARFAEHVDALCEALVERGNNIIHDTYGGDEDEAGEG